MARSVGSPLPKDFSAKGSVRVGDVDIAWEERGEGRRPLVLVHGYTGSRDDWREQMPRLAVLGRTIAVDQRGHGESTNTGDPGGYSFEQLVSDLLGALDALGVDRCDLLERIASHASLAVRLGEISCPTLVIVGEEDRVFLAPAAALAAGIPGAQYTRIPGAAHSPQLESPDAWFDAIREHLERARV